MSYQYLVVYEKSSDGWGAYVPDLPGLGAVGDTLEEVQQLIREGTMLHLESLKEHGEPIPKPAAKSDYMNVDILLSA
ncbi:MAG: type II toxin-antitoxin system HicB family antitoxin [Acidobacteriaceae bacterium]